MHEQGPTRREPTSLLPWTGVAAVAAWGLSFVATRVALEGFTPAGLVTARLVVGSALLAALLRRRGETLLPRREDRLRCALLGAVLGGHILLQTVGLRFTTAVRTGWIIALIPALIAAANHLVLGQRLRGGGWIGLLVASGGVALVTSTTPAGFADAGLGDLLMLVSCFSWTLYTLLAADVARRNGSLRVTAVALGVAGLVVACAVPYEGVTVGAPPTQAWVALAFLAVVCSGLAYLLWSQALTTHGATRAGATLYYEPLVTLVAAVALLGEPAGANTLVGGAGVLLGVWMVGRGAD